MLWPAAAVRRPMGNLDHQQGHYGKAEVDANIISPSIPFSLSCKSRFLYCCSIIFVLKSIATPSILYRHHVSHISFLPIPTDHSCDLLTSLPRPCRYRTRCCSRASRKCRGPFSPHGSCTGQFTSQVAKYGETTSLRA